MTEVLQNYRKELDSYQCESQGPPGRPSGFRQKMLSVKILFCYELPLSEFPPISTIVNVRIMSESIVVVRVLCVVRHTPVRTVWVAQGQRSTLTRQML